MQTTPLPQTPLARQTLDGLERAGDAAEQTVQQVRERVVPAAVRLASQAEDLAHRGLEAVREGSQQLRQRTAAATERGIDYVRDEPVKSVLFAAAAGAALMALVQFVGNRRQAR